MTALSIVATNATKGESEQSSLKLCLGLLLAVMAKFSVFDLNKIKQNSWVQELRILKRHKKRRKLMLIN